MTRSDGPHAVGRGEPRRGPRKGSRSSSSTSPPAMWRPSSAELRVTASFGATHRAGPGGRRGRGRTGKTGSGTSSATSWLLRTLSSSSAPSSAASTRSCSAAALAAVVRGRERRRRRQAVEHAPPVAGGDLEAIVSGTPQLDRALRSVATYEGGYSADHPAVRLFWEVVPEDLNFDEQKQLLMFATALSRRPSGPRKPIQGPAQEHRQRPPDPPTAPPLPEPSRGR